MKVFLIILLKAMLLELVSKDLLSIRTHGKGLFMEENNLELSLMMFIQNFIIN